MCERWRYMFVCVSRCFGSFVNTDVILVNMAQEVWSHQSAMSCRLMWTSAALSERVNTVCAAAHEEDPLVFSGISQSPGSSEASGQFSGQTCNNIKVLLTTQRLTRTDWLWLQQHNRILRPQTHSQVSPAHHCSLIVLCSLIGTQRFYCALFQTLETRGHMVNNLEILVFLGCAWWMKTFSKCLCVCIHAAWVVVCRLSSCCSEAQLPIHTEQIQGRPEVLVKWVLGAPWSLRGPQKEGIF